LTTWTQFYLGRVFLDQHRGEDAERVFRDVLAIEGERQGMDDLDPVATRYWLARALEDQHRLDEAEIEYRPCLKRVARYSTRRIRRSPGW
jgi:hypothetical protein